MLFKEAIKQWRGARYQKEAAADLDIPVSTYRKYENGKRTPSSVAMAELLRRMEEHQETAARKASEAYLAKRGEQSLLGAAARKSGLKE